MVLFSLSYYVAGHEERKKERLTDWKLEEGEYVGW